MKKFLIIGILLLIIISSGCISDYSMWAKKDAKYYALKSFCEGVGGKLKITSTFQAKCNYEGIDYFINVQSDGKMELTENNEKK